MLIDEIKASGFHNKEYQEEMDQEITSPGVIRTINRRLKKVFGIFVYKFRADACLIRASGLAYSSLMALIPLSAVLLTLFTSLGGLNTAIENIQRFLVQTLIPTRQEELSQLLEGFLSNTRTLGTAGISIYLVTSIIFLQNLENNFNTIWGSKPTKNFIERFTRYTAVFVYTTLFISLSYSLSPGITSILKFTLPEDAKTISFVLQKGLSVIFIFFTLVLIISLIPSGKVSFISACIGSAIGTLFWSLAKYLFTFWANRAVRFSIVYGSLSLIPIFFIWIYLIWLIILSAFEITHIHQNRGSLFSAEDSSCFSSTVAIAFGIYLTIAKQFMDGKSPPGKTTLSKQFGIPESMLEEILLKFTAKSLLLDTEHGYVPGIDLGAVSLGQIYLAMYGRNEQILTELKEESPFLKMGKHISAEILQSGIESCKTVDVRSKLIQHFTDSENVDENIEEN